MQQGQEGAWVVDEKAEALRGKRALGVTRMSVVKVR